MPTNPKIYFLSILYDYSTRLGSRFTLFEIFQQGFQDNWSKSNYARASFRQTPNKSITEQLVLNNH